MDVTKILNLAADAAESGAESSGSGGTGGGSNMIIMVVYILVIVAALYFIMIRPQRKKSKKEEALRNNIQVGDEIVTVGGIYGRVVSIKDDSLIIESPADRSKQRIAKWSVQQNLTIHDDAQ